MAQRFVIIKDGLGPVDCEVVPKSPSSRGLGHRPFTPETRVRLPLGTLFSGLFCTASVLFDAAATFPYPDEINFFKIELCAVGVGDSCTFDNFIRDVRMMCYISRGDLKGNSI